MQNGFQIIAGKKTWTFFCQTKDEKNQWVQNFGSTLETLVKKTPALQGKPVSEVKYGPSSLVRKIVDFIL